MSEKENVYTTGFPIKTYDSVNVTLSDGGTRKTLREKKISVLSCAQGMTLLEIDNSIYPVRHFRENLDFHVEKKFKPRLVGLLIFGIVFQYALFIWNISLQTGMSYFNPVTIITMFFMAGLLFMLFGRMSKEQQMSLDLVRVKLEWHKVETPGIPGRHGPIERWKGYSGSSVIAAFVTGLMIAFGVGLSYFVGVRLPLLDSIDESQRWIMYTDENAEKAVIAYIQTRTVLISVISTVGILILIAGLIWGYFNIKSIRELKQKEESPKAIISNAVNFEKEKGFTFIDHWYDGFENRQKDLTTLEAAAIMEAGRTKINVELDKNKKPKKTDTTFLRIADQAIIKGLTLAEARILVNKTYSEIQAEAEGKDGKKKNFAAAIVKEILDTVKHQVAEWYAIANFWMGLAAVMAASQEGLKMSLNESFKQLQDVKIIHRGMPELQPKKKGLDFSHYLMFGIIGILAIICIGLLVALSIKSNLEV